MQEITPEIQAKLLERAMKNVKWIKKLEDACAALPEGDPKHEKVEKLRDVLKIQAMVIVKKLKELEDDGTATEPATNNVKDNLNSPLKRDPSLSTRGFNGGMGSQASGI